MGIRENFVDEEKRWIVVKYNQSWRGDGRWRTPRGGEDENSGQMKGEMGEIAENVVARADN